jgi:LuxR family maltose regulon positive regulatory protein
MNTMYRCAAVGDPPKTGWSARASSGRQRGSDRALPLLSEALSIAAMRGCLRVAEDAHPAAVAMRDRLAAGGKQKSAPVQPVVRTPASKSMAAAGGLLTLKEADVLGLLAAGHSNKHIGKVMDVSDETVKWHLKHLFSKLSAGTRKHAVDRARMMGLVIDEVSNA